MSELTDQNSAAAPDFTGDTVRPCSQQLQSRSSSHGQQPSPGFHREPNPQRETEAQPAEGIVQGGIGSSRAVAVPSSFDGEPVSSLGGPLQARTEPKRHGVIACTPFGAEIFVQGCIFNTTALWVFWLFGFFSHY